MLKRMAPAAAERCLAEAARSPRSNPRTAYPPWYLQRWHFLPEGYLSRRSAAGYEALIRRLYNLAQEAAVLDSLVEAMRPNRPKTVLELGCGPGIALERLAAAFPDARFTGADLSPFMLERAERRNSDAEQIELIHADGTKLPWSAPVFDTIVAVHYFGHLPRPERMAAYSEARRVLAPGGHLYVLDHAWHGGPSTHSVPERHAALLGGVLRLSTYAMPGVSSHRGWNSE